MAEKLTDVAVQMQKRCLDQAESYPDLGFWCAQHALERGLLLTLEMRATTWALSLSRAGMTPSQVEIDVIRRDFRIPPEVTTTRGLCESKTRTTKIVRLKWSRVQQKGLFDNESEAA